MNIDHGSDVANKFVTNIGLITSSGPHGDNIMAAEWTYHVSYEPGIVVISIRDRRATYDNIMKTKEFVLWKALRRSLLFYHHISIKNEFS